jgi:hypothetical protein
VTSVVLVSTTRRIAVVVAWLAITVGAVLLVASSQIRFLDPTGAGFTLVFVSLAFDAMVFGTVGAALALRRPGNAIGVVLIAAGLLIAPTFLGFIFAAVPPGATTSSDDRLAGLMGLVGGLGIYPTIIIAGPLLALLFPDGHLPDPRWRWPVALIAAILALGSVLVLVRPGPIGEGLATNPFGIGGVPWLEAVAPFGESLGTIALLTSLVLVLVAVGLRYRRSASGEREQLKWFVAANVLVMIFLFLSLADGATEPTAFDLLAVTSLSLPPIAVGIAILRYRLYEIDTIINRALVYGLLTAIVAGIYAASVGVMQRLSNEFLGGSSEATIIVTTVLIVTAFTPIKSRLQALVDRRFKEAGDANALLEPFTKTLHERMWAVEPSLVLRRFAEVLLAGLRAAKIEVSQERSDASNVVGIATSDVVPGGTWSTASTVGPVTLRLIATLGKDHVSPRDLEAVNRALEAVAMELHE